LFTERGFAGTSMRDIAGASGISQPLIHHHFGTKEDLYAAVRRRIIEDYVAASSDDARVTDRPADVKAEMTRLFGFLRRNESVMRMMAWSRLEGYHRMFAGDLELRQAMIERIALAQQQGIIRDDLSPAFVMIMIEALVVNWIDNREFNSGLFESKPNDDCYLQQAISLMERGLSSRTP
jgi:TetR/AcrR family transcriptional regulator